MKLGGLRNRGGVHRARLPGSGFFEISENIDQHKLLGRAQYGTHARNAGNFLGFELGIAAYDGHKSIGIVLEGLLYHFATLAVGVVGDGAGIDDVQVGSGFEGNFLKALFFKLTADGRGFRKVQLAAEGVKSDRLGGKHKLAKVWPGLRIPYRALLFAGKVF